MTRNRTARSKDAVLLRSRSMGAALAETARAGKTLLRKDLCNLYFARESETKRSSYGRTKRSTFVHAKGVSALTKSKKRNHPEIFGSSSPARKTNLIPAFSAIRFESLPQTHVSFYRSLRHQDVHAAPDVLAPAAAWRFFLFTGQAAQPAKRWRYRVSDRSLP
jgi:hypothetical protein